MGKNEFCHLDDEHRSNVFCLSLSLLASQPSSEFWRWVGVRELGDVRLTVRWRSPLSFHWLPAFPPSLCKAHLAVGRFVLWWSHLPRMEQEPEPLRPAQNLLVMDDSEAEFSQNTLLLSFPCAMIQDGQHQTFFPPLCSACPPSTVLGLVLSTSLAPTTFPHFSSPPGSSLFSYKFTFPSSRSQSTGLLSWGCPPSATLFTLPYCCAYRPLHHHRLCKLSFPPNAPQAKMKNPLGRVQWQLASLACFHVTANIVPCPPVAGPSSGQWLPGWIRQRDPKQILYVACNCALPQTLLSCRREGSVCFSGNNITFNK